MKGGINLEKCTCINCGRQFMGRTSKQCFYCSEECKKQYKKTHTKKYSHICDFCGKEFENPKKNYKTKHKFCSRECYDKYQSSNKKEKRKCEICGKYFECTISSKQRFCNIKCQAKWQSIYRVGENSSTYNSEISLQERTLKCEWCGKEFIVGAYKINKSRFCCVTCKQEWYSKIWSQTQEWKNKSRIRAVNILKNNNEKVSTTPQQKVLKILQDNDINFEIEKNCKYYSLDIYLKEKNLGIEIMGTYWHCDSRKYKQIKYPSQKKRITMDKRKRTYIKNKYNIPILYIWEEDTKNIELCEELILYFIKQQGNLPNYHSFNYQLKKNKINLNSEIIIPYMELSSENIKNFYILPPTTTE